MENPTVNIAVEKLRKARVIKSIQTSLLKVLTTRNLDKHLQPYAMYIHINKKKRIYDYVCAIKLCKPSFPEHVCPA